MKCEWYVIQTLKGQELKNAMQIRQEVVKKDENVFVIENEMQYRIRGEWIVDRTPFFPGYVFVEISDSDAEDFDARLRKKLHPLKLITVGGEITPINPEEKEYLLLLAGDEHVIKHSAGFKVYDRVEISSGTFKGFNGEIKRLDRHNRRAKISLPLMGREVEVEIGLEIVKVH